MLLACLMQTSSDAVFTLKQPSLDVLIEACNQLELYHCNSNDSCLTSFIHYVNFKQAVKVSK